MKRKLFLLLFVFVIFSANLFAQYDFGKPLPNDPNVRIGKLKNGLTYYIRKNLKPEKKVELRLAVNTGSVLERDDQQGLAHFLEHMAFNGTKNFPKNELVSYLQSIGVDFGADLNAYTSFDETVYMLSVPTDKPELLDKGFLVLEDWASNITLDPAEIDKERGVVLEELRLGKGANQRMRDKYLPYLLYGSQYAKRLPIGQKELLETFKPQVLQDFYKEWYRPDLMAVVAVGDLDPDFAEAKIKEHFEKLAPKTTSKARQVFDIPDHKETFISVETDKEAPMTMVQLMFKKPPISVKTFGDSRQALVRSFFGSMLGARLDEIRQSPNSPFIFAGGGFGSFTRNKGAYSMIAATSPEKVKDALNTLLLENRRVKEYGFTEAEFKRQKDTYLKMFENMYKEREKSQSANFADQYVAAFLNQTPVSGIEFDYEFAKAVFPTITLQEVNALAKQTTSDTNRVIVVTGSDKAGVVYPTKDAISALLKDAEIAKVTPYTEKVLTEPLVANLPVTAKLTAEKNDEKFGITYWTLSNGVKVILKPTDFKADEILMRGFSPGGSSLVANDKVISASFADSVVDESGLKNLSKVELEKSLAGKRANVSVAISEMFENVFGSSTPEDLETMLQLIYLKFNAVNFQKPVFDTIITNEKMLMTGMGASPENYFSKEVSRIQNQNDPRHFSRFDATTYDKINFEDVKAIYQDRFADASDFTFVFIGNFDNEKVKPLILKYLGNLPNKNRVEKGKDLGYRPVGGKIEKVIKKGLEQKSIVRIEFGGETKYSRDESRSLSALGELLTIKLTEILREEKGGVYGVGARGGMSKLPYENYYFTINFPSGPENVESLTEDALNEVRKIQNGQIEDKDIAKVIEARLVKNRESYKQNNYWYSLIYNNQVNGLDILDETQNEQRIRAITKEDIQKAAQKYLKIDERQQFVLMPEVGK